MNERIRELELQAIAYADSKVPAEDRYNDIYHSIVRRMLVELIVQECASIDFYKLAHIGTEDDYNVTQVIKEHFGVRE